MHILDSKNNSIGEPLCYEPILADDFEKWLNKPLKKRYKGLDFSKSEYLIYVLMKINKLI